MGKHEPFTTELAAIYQARSVETRKANKLAAEQARLEASQPRAIADRIAVTELQIDRLDGQINDTEDPSELLKLTQTKRELIKVWQLLSGFPSPGTRRGRSGNSQTTLPVPVPVSPSKPA